ncbi:MAG: hypothetical protein WD066_17690 [Planctomycetaceae bacterium]
MPSNGFSAISFDRSAARKNCLAMPHRRLTVFSASVPAASPVRRDFGCCNSHSRNASASPGVTSRSGFPAPKNASKFRRAFRQTMSVSAFTSVRFAM